MGVQGAKPLAGARGTLSGGQVILALFSPQGGPEARKTNYDLEAQGHTKCPSWLPLVIQSVPSDPKMDVTLHVG